MANPIVVQKNGLEQRAKGLIISFRTSDHGAMRYDFPSLLLLEVEEVYQGKTTPGILRIKDRVILNDTRGNGLRGDYLPESSFAKKFRVGLDEILGEVNDAIEAHMAKKPARSGIAITDKGFGDYSNMLCYNFP